MSIHVNKKNNDLNTKFNIVVSAEKKYNQHVKASVDTHRLTMGKDKDVTAKQYDFVKNFDGVKLSVNDNLAVFTDSANTVAKPLFVQTAQISGSPLHQIKIASQRERESNFTVQTALEMAKYDGYNNVYAYFLTLTVPNCKKAQLDYTFSQLSLNRSEFIKALADGTRRKSGLRLPSLTGSYTEFLGSLSSLEVTLNKNSMKLHSSDNLYHPHCHILLLTASKIDLDKASHVLFNYWKQKNQSLTLSYEAFFLEPCYSKNADDFDLTEAVSEASKYAVKPDFYKNLPSVPTNFSMDVFSEVFKTVKGRQMKAVTGYFWKAKKFLGKLKRGIRVNGKKYSLLNSVMSAGYKDQKVHVPDILTEFKNFDGKKFNGTRDLADSELLFANRGLLENVEFMMPNNLAWGQTKEAKLYKWLLTERINFVEVGALDDKLNEYSNIRLDQINSELAKEDVNDDVLEKREHQLEDCESLYDAYCTNLSGMSELDYIDIKPLIKRRDLYIALSNSNMVLQQNKNGYNLSFDADCVKSAEIEKSICDTFLNDPVKKIKYDFIPNEVIADYINWINGLPNFTDDMNNADMGSYSVINPLLKRVDVLQTYILDTFS